MKRIDIAKVMRRSGCHHGDRQDQEHYHNDDYRSPAFAHGWSMRDPFRSINLI